jgi:hypothetical protein
MTRAVLLVIPLFLWLVSRPLSLAPTLEAATYKCILQNSCTPPPCEFFTELKYNKAAARILANARAPLSRSNAAYRQYSNDIIPALRKVLRKHAKCPPSETPFVTVSQAPKCEIGVVPPGGGVQPQTLDDLQRASSGCSESVEAQYASAQVLQNMCASLKPSGRTVAEDRAIALLLQQSVVDSLEQSLLRYLSSCKPDANTARQIAKMGLSPLLRAGQKARGVSLGKWVASQNALGAAGGGARP